MTVIADITVPASAFALGQVLDEFPGVQFELERVVPLQEDVPPMIWISGGDIDAIETALSEQPQTIDVNHLATANAKSLFEVRLNSEIGDIVLPVKDTRAYVLEAMGTADHWDLRLRFASHENLSEFNVALTDKGIPVTLRHLYNPTAPTDESPLSPTQRDMLLTLYQRGYFEVPRKMTLNDLATEWGISDSALSQRLRRALSRLIEQSLVSE